MNPSTELLLRVNGIQPAFGLEFGLKSPRADEGRAGDPLSGPLGRERLGEELRRVAGDGDFHPAGHGVVLGATEACP